MARSSFVSFHYQRDHWRVQQILNIGALDRQPELPSQEWEQVKSRGDAAVEAWIDEQMNYKQAVIVMIGHETATRKFVKYEIRRAWTIKKPLLGIRIHGLKDYNGSVDTPGANPFAQFGFADSSLTYADFAPVFDPQHYTGKGNPSSTEVHTAIRKHVAEWASRGYRRP